MSVTLKALVEPVAVPTVAASLFTSSANTRIDACYVANPDAVNTADVTVYLVPSGGSAGASNAVYTTKTLQPLETWIVTALIGQVLAAGDSIQAIKTGSAAPTIRASGTVIT